MATTARPPGNDAPQAHRHHSDMSDEERAGAIEQGLKLEYFSLTWNVLETAVGAVAGLASGSVALIGFALDSVIESSSASILIWRLKKEGTPSWDVESVERRAVRAIAIAFWGLALYVAARALIDLTSGHRPDESLLGIALAIVSLIVMPVLAARKRSAAKVLDSRAMHADSSQTSLCTYMSAVLLFGLAANAFFGWWWADPVAGLGIAVLAAREGYELWTTEDFCVH